MSFLVAKPKMPAAAPTATRDDAAEAAAMDDRLRMRRGSAANEVMGTRGAEAPNYGAKALMGQ